MKKVVLAVFAAASLAAVAAPAFAHDGDDDDWRVWSYDGFGQQYHRIWEGIQHGVSDGSYSPGEAQYFYRQLGYIQARADWEQRTDRFDPDEINDRLGQLRERMHIAHRIGHERLENGDWSAPYGYQPYGYQRYGYGRW